MKHGEGKQAAHDLYVYQQCTINEIASQTGRGEKTIRLWIDEGNWKPERDQYIKNRVSVHEKLYSIVNTLADKLITDLSGGEQVDSGRLYTFRGLVSELNNLYKYEGAVKKETDSEKPKDQEGLSDETINEIEKRLKLL